MRTPSTPLLSIRPENATGLCDDEVNGTLGMGCHACPEFSTCGGLRTTSGFVSCDQLCRCKGPDRPTCLYVCRNRPVDYVLRVREVNTFDLGTLDRVQPLPLRPLPSVVPFLDPKRISAQLRRLDAVAVNLFDLISLAVGTRRYASRQGLSSRYGLALAKTIVASGVAKDHRVERWWTMPNRPSVPIQLRDSGVDLVTVPNFSLFSDAPRPDNLYAMKRIGIVWTEFMKAGVRAALHTNARSTHDYARWAQFILEREEVDTIAFEFGSGCGDPTLMPRHVKHLCSLAAFVGRPLTLIVRGGVGSLQELREHFAHVLYIDTDSVMKAVHRRKAYVLPNDKIKWFRSPTRIGEPIDELLFHNIRTIARVRGASSSGLSPVPPNVARGIGLTQSDPETARAVR